MHDLGPATRAVADLVAHVKDEDLARATPCDDYRLCDLLQHLDGLAGAFTRAARKEADVDDAGPSGDATRLPSDWRSEIPQRLAELAEAWRDESAWSGPTAAGGLVMDGSAAGLVAIDEVVLHGWDIARATGQRFEPDAASVAAARSFVDQFSGPGSEEMRQGLFGPEVSPPHDATPLEELVALSGRRPR